MRIFSCNFANFSREHAPKPPRMVAPWALPLKLISDVTRLRWNLTAPSEILCLRHWCWLMLASAIVISTHAEAFLRLTQNSLTSFDQLLIRIHYPTGFGLTIKRRSVWLEASLTPVQRSLKMLNCEVPPNHLRSEIWFSYTCNIPKRWKNKKTRKSSLK